MRIITMALVVAGTVMVTGCAGPRAIQPAAQSDYAAAATAHISAAAAFGDRQTLTTGLAVTISAPRSLTPSDTAYPRAARAAVFQLAIDNGTRLSYKPSQFTVKATLAGKATEEVVDPAQGLTGFVSAAQDIPPGKSATLTLAFAMPPEQRPLSIVLQLDAAQAGPATAYQGMA